MVREVGPGLKGKRPKLRRVLSDAPATVIVVEHRDRLARFGMEHLEAALAVQSCRVVIDDPGETTDDLVRDMLEVLTSKCARLHGARVCATGLAGRSPPRRKTQRRCDGAV